jgi:ABC-type nitrate/sulfonate/bicarbonate transport system permease component
MTAETFTDQHQGQNVAEADGRQKSSPTPVSRIPGQPGPFDRYEGLILGGGSVLVFLVIWEAVALSRIVPPLFLPGPSDIWNAFVHYVQEGMIWTDLYVSGQGLAYGYCLAVLVALPIGLLTGWYSRVNKAFDPFINFMNATPRIALIPLFIIWFGIGVGSKVAVIFFAALFPILINTQAGIRNLDPGWVKTARSFGATDPQLFRTVALPGAVPFILTGMRIGIGHALIAVVFSEMVAAQAGIGLMMATAGATFDTARVFVGLVIVATWGIVLATAISVIETYFQGWRPQQK